ncbi:subunit 4 of prefoldin [Chloropicon primus]|uniref:Prefoldin subunit 4 n=1 Tax=Chloropicon primus TaxID=1764295 RepID=A0A5B8MYZ6_9CHLO|nr:subunit 4 of prefoldin [Chloropicon primus]UPR03832.1 subunit 4 of prefoldin [Chloropicon primus]|mmetsp:Transcript_3252/g.9047  ORF Transcript_3252/g.9047 Transcript_3252/m.9047 type:complete len:126 (+) Transcript_3252:172-549(+)|eukprot:QDZ24624.1 subunit 4 of prefoldin [Chloropicon primus]
MPSAPNAPQVTKEDQDQINAFGRLNNHYHEIQGKIKAKKKYSEDLEDASNELMLADGDIVKYSYGFVFVHMSEDTAEEKLTAAQEEVDQDITALEGELQDIRKNMDGLKTTLYSKFGNTINLEEE